MSKTTEVSLSISASASQLYDMVSDVTRMGEWSPETTRCEWLKGATVAVQGARFRGVNRNGSKKWAIVCEVVDAEPGKHFSFDATAGPLRYARWGYRFDEADGVTNVTEYVTDNRGKITSWAGRPISGVKDRETHNRDGMTATLAALKAAAESSGEPTSEPAGEPNS